MRRSLPDNPEKVVINTGPLIALNLAEALDVIGRLPFEFHSPPAIERELRVGVSKGYPLIMPAWLKITDLKQPINPIAALMLDEGEAEVIQLACEFDRCSVCIDERKGRRLAVAVGLKVTGALGLLLTAKRLGLIPCLKPFFDRLSESKIWYDPALVHRILAEAGE